MRGGPRGDDGGEDSGDSSSHSCCCDSCHGSDGSAISVICEGERRVASTFGCRKEVLLEFQPRRFIHMWP